jgi:hypothetical protein
VIALVMTTQTQKSLSAWLLSQIPGLLNRFSGLLGGPITQTRQVLET